MLIICLYPFYPMRGMKANEEDITHAPNEVLRWQLTEVKNSKVC